MASHTERVHLNHTAAQLFDLVADVERYPEFLPWVIAAHIQRRKGRNIWVRMTISAGFLRKSFSTVAALDRPHNININSDDALFEYFEQKWKFDHANHGGADVEYHVDYKFRSRLLQALVGASFAERTRTMVAAFTHRARQLYDNSPRSNLRNPS